MSKKKGLLVLLFTFLLCPFISAQQLVFEGEDASKRFVGADVYRQQKDSDLPSYVHFSGDSHVEESSFFATLREQLGLNADLTFKLERENEDNLGLLHKTYSQYLDGIRIAYSVIKVHTKNGEVISFNGNFINHVASAREASLNTYQAFQRALNFMGADEYFGNIGDYYSYELDQLNGQLEYLPPFLNNGGKACAYLYF